MKKLLTGTKEYRYGKCVCVCVCVSHSNIGMLGMWLVFFHHHHHHHSIHFIVVWFLVVVVSVCHCHHHHHHHCRRSTWKKRKKNKQKSRIEIDEWRLSMKSIRKKCMYACVCLEQILNFIFIFVEFRFGALIK